MNTKFYIEDKIDGNRVFEGFYTYYETLEEAEAAADVIFYALPNRFRIGQVSR